MNDKRHPDADLIDRLGGSSEVARKLGERYSVQRVGNWKTRGVPELLKWQRQDVFGPAPGTKKKGRGSSGLKAA